MSLLNAPRGEPFPNVTATTSFRRAPAKAPRREPFRNTTHLLKVAFFHIYTNPPPRCHLQAVVVCLSRCNNASGVLLDIADFKEFDQILTPLTHYLKPFPNATPKNRLCPQAPPSLATPSHHPPDPPGPSSTPGRSNQPPTTLPRPTLFLRFDLADFKEFDQFLTPLTHYLKPFPNATPNNRLCPQAPPSLATPSHHPPDPPGPSSTPGRPNYPSADLLRSTQIMRQGTDLYPLTHYLKPLPYTKHHATNFGPRTPRSSLATPSHHPPGPPPDHALRVRVCVCVCVCVCV
jgi:hypothetical protein